MPLIAGIMFGTTTCVHCGSPTEGPGETCRCAAGILFPGGRRRDAGEVFFGAPTRLHA